MTYNESKLIAVAIVLAANVVWLLITLDNDRYERKRRQTGVSLKKDFLP